MVKNSAKKPGPTGKLTALAKDCHEKGMTQMEARVALIAKHKTSDGVAKSTISHVYASLKPLPQSRSSQRKPKIRPVVKHMSQTQKDEIMQRWLRMEEAEK